jgi:hypothetical protein
MVLSNQESQLPKQFTAQIDRILQSSTFHSSEVSRRLLRFLWQKVVAGEAEQLKEYAIAVEALGKPDTYDPHVNSLVRIQTGRLRQKLSEYYAAEGKDDPVTVQLPRGSFKLAVSEQKAPSQFESRSSRWLLGASAFIILAALLWAAYSVGAKTARVSRMAPPSTFANPDVEALWHPFVVSNRPWIIAMEDPLFIRFKGLVCRDPALNDWASVQGSAEVAGMNQVLHVDYEPSRYYTAFGAVNASFLLGRMLAGRQNVSLIRSSELSLQQMADNNVILVGRQARFAEQLTGSPITPQLTTDAAGIVNLHPNPGEPQQFLNHSDGSDDQGEAYALVSRLPGPEGGGQIQIFSSQSTVGYMSAIQWFSDPAMANGTLQRLRTPSGQMPRYYQVVLKVRYKDFVPTETNWVLTRQLQ